MHPTTGLSKGFGMGARGEPGREAGLGLAGRGRRIDRVTARRALLGRLVALVLAASSTCPAQTRRARVGWLALSPSQGSGVRSLSETLFLGMLQQKGWRESANLIFDVRGPAADRSLAAAAAELVSLRPDVLAASGTPAIRILRDLTKEIPIVMVGAGDPVGTGLVASLARPGGNVTGVSWRLDDLIPKTLSLLHEMVPRAKRVDFVNQARDPGHSFFANVMLDSARSLGLASQVFEVRDEDELVSTIAGSNADAILMLATQLIYAHPERIAAAAISRKLPLAITGGPGRDPTARGILCCYCAKQDELFRRAADCVDRILRGGNPAEIPVEQPLRYDFIINLKTAGSIGLPIPRAVLLRADELID
jgi:putative ABC transport system substrate-binding protein